MRADDTSAGLLIGVDLGKVTTSLAWGRSAAEGAVEILGTRALRHHGDPLAPFFALYRELGGERIAAVAVTGVFSDRLGDPVLAGVPEEIAQQEAVTTLCADGPLLVVHIGGAGRRRRAHRLRPRRHGRRLPRRLSGRGAPARRAQRDRRPRDGGGARRSGRRPQSLPRRDRRTRRQVHQCARRTRRRQRHEPRLQRGDGVVPRGAGGGLRTRRHHRTGRARRPLHRAARSRADLHRLRRRCGGRGARPGLQPRGHLRRPAVLRGAQLLRQGQGRPAAARHRVLPGQAGDEPVAGALPGRGHRPHRGGAGGPRRHGRDRCGAVGRRAAGVARLRRVVRRGRGARPRRLPRRRGSRRDRALARPSSTRRLPDGPWSSSAARPT